MYMMLLPNELKFEIIKHSFPHDIFNLCQVNSDWASFFIANKESIAKQMLKTMQVDYQDPTIFIYVMNKKNANDYKQEDTWNYTGIFKLYYRFYNEKAIDLLDNLITSFPIMPKLERLECNSNQLTSIPIMPKLEY